MGKDKPKKPQCPECESSVVEYRIRTDEYVCRRCGNRWAANKNKVQF